MQDVHRGLSLPCRLDRVNAKLYKLLLYEEGAFFKAHQDSEKETGMFGTLVVSLPSYHEGGQVLLTHGKKSETYDSASFGEYGTSVAAWYADVFHEVKPVTKGYRMVLTYNLIQEPGTTAMKAPTSDYVQILTGWLQVYEKELKLKVSLGDSEFPDYLAWKLEQQYTKNGLSLDTLKGNDFAQVAALKAACDQLGFELYLAAFAKQRTVDSYSGDRVNSEDGCDWVCRLDGSKCSFSPTHEKEAELANDEGYDTEDEEPDETDHQPYMGNWGGDNTKWYRSTLLFIVPPSKHIDFVVGHSPYTFWKGAADLLPRLNRMAASKLHTQEQLWELCKRASIQIPNPQKILTTRADLELQKKAVTQVAIACAKFDWLSWYDKLDLSYRLNIDCLIAIDLNMASGGVAAKTASIDQILQSDILAWQKLACLEALRAGFLPDADDERKAEFETWQETALQEILVSTWSTGKRDGSALARMLPLTRFNPEIDILPIIQKFGLFAAAGFIWSLACSDEVVPESNEELSCMDAALEQLWNNFGYKQNQSDEAITKDELVVILQTTKEHEIDLGEKLELMRKKLILTDGTYLSNHLFPFVNDILAKRVWALTLEGDAKVATSAFITSVLAHYITKYVKPKPAPITHSLPQRGCGCAHCRVVDAFMASPTRTELKYQCGKSTRHHLHTYFTNIDPRRYTVDTIRTTHPETWHVVKKLSASQAQDADWDRRFNEAHSKIKALAERDVVLMVDVLGENYNAIMSCRAENVAELLKKKEVLQPTSGNVAAGASNGTKRKTAEQDNVFGARNVESKRQRTSEVVADVIDLTDD